MVFWPLDGAREKVERKLWVMSSVVGNVRLHSGGSFTSQPRVLGSLSGQKVHHWCKADNQTMGRRGEVLRQCSYWLLEAEPLKLRNFLSSQRIELLVPLEVKKVQGLSPTRGVQWQHSL